jgi:hypothetical protein
MMTALSVTLPKILKTEPVLSPSAGLLRCLWSWLLPHPFVERAVRLTKMIIEQIAPSPAGRNLTLEDPANAAARESLDHAPESFPRVLSRSHLREDVVAIHFNPTVARGTPCLEVTSLMVLKLHVARPVVASTESQRNKWSVWHSACQLHVPEGAIPLLANRTCVVLMLPEESEAEAQQLSMALESRRHSPHERIVSMSALMRRSNRLTKFLRVVLEKRKLYLGSGNLLLQNGLTPAAMRPFELRNPFPMDEALLRSQTCFWNMVASGPVVEMSTWSAWSRVLVLRTWQWELV